MGWRKGAAKFLKVNEKVLAEQLVWLFSRAIHMQKLNFIEKWMINNLKALQGDFRDWDAITSWAATIADVLKETVMASGMQSE